MTYIILQRYIADFSTVKIIKFKLVKKFKLVILNNVFFFKQLFVN